MTLLRFQIQKYEKYQLGTEEPPQAAQAGPPSAADADGAPSAPALNAPVLTFILLLPSIDPILESYFPKLKSKIVKSSESLCLSNIYLLKNKLCEENTFCSCLIFI